MFLLREFRLNSSGEFSQQLTQSLRASAKMHALQISHPEFMATTSMRLISLLLLNGFSLTAFAAKPVPDNLEPLPPPPAIGSTSDDAPEVTIIKQTEQTVEEFRAGGKLYMIKITPKVGKPYYLVDDQGDGKFSRQESLDSGVRPPRWVIHRF
jgi:hypothetical protein